MADRGVAYQKLFRSYLRDLSRILEHFAQHATPAELNALAGEPAFKAFADMIAERMATGALTENARNWRMAAAKAGQGRMIFESLQQDITGSVQATLNRIVRENAELIRTLPIGLARKTTKYVATRQQAGIRSEQVAKELRVFLPDLAKGQIRRIARTEVGKAESALTRARSENLGLNWYQWTTSNDERVRKSHRKMDKVLCAWNDPPSPELLAGEETEGHYAPGSIYNCRCLSLPLVSLDEVTWPARVYHLGRIERMTRKRFSGLM